MHHASRTRQSIPYAIGVLAVAGICLGSHMANGSGIEPGIYLILSRTLRIRDARGTGFKGCAVAAYRWRLGSKEAPVKIDGMETPYDCGGYGVEDGHLYRVGLNGHDTYLDLSGRKLGERPRVPYESTTVSTIKTKDVRVEDTQVNTISGQGSILRVFSSDGRMVNERPISGLGVDAVSPDGSRIYLSQRSDFTDGFMGPWPFLTYDWKTGQMAHLSDVEKSVSYGERALNPQGHMMLYVLNRHIVDPEGHGWSSTTPSELHMLDLASGQDTLLRKAADGEPFSNPRFSPDGTRYLIETPGTDTLYDLTPNSPPLDAFAPHVADWFDDTVVLDAPDQEFPELIVRDLKTKKDVTVSKDLASFEYVGRVWQP